MPDPGRRRLTSSGPHRLGSRRAPDPRTRELTDPAAGLANALVAVRATARAARYPLAVPSAAAAGEAVAALVTQLDDYMIPRLRRMDGPLLAVVGGSTGAGKSTLVNSLVRAPISPAGVLRPTTRAPLLVANPADTGWFLDRSVLPRLARASTPGEQILQVINAPYLAPGLALVDAPDIDSVVAANRALARELLAAGDLWLFVTTAARYADAVPWRVLREARDRGTEVAIILDRVPAEARDEISIHFARMLGSQGLGDTGLFIVPESTLDEHGLLPELDSAPIKRWLDAVASSAAQRRRVTRRTLLGAIAAVGPRVEELARAADDQIEAAARLAGTVRTAYGAAMSDVESALRGGAMLRGEVYSRWQELIASGEMRQALRARTGPRRAEVSASLAARAAPGPRLLPALARALAARVAESDVVAAQQCREQWRAGPASRVLLAADPALGTSWPGFADAAHDLVSGWQTWLRTVARQEAPRVRTRTRSYATAATVLLATVAAVAPPLDDVTATGDGPSMLRAVLADNEIRSLGDRARADFLVRVGNLLAVEIQRHLAPVSAAGVNPELGPSLRATAVRLRAARSEFVRRLKDAAA